MYFRDLEVQLTSNLVGCYMMTIEIHWYHFGPMGHVTSVYFTDQSVIFFDIRVCKLHAGHMITFQNSI